MNTNFDLNPGPIDNRILYLEDQHGAWELFLNPDSGKRCVLDIKKRGDRDFWLLAYDDANLDRDFVLPPRIVKYIKDFGFAGILQCKYKKLDRCLIEALIERWRPETNTFHLPIGDATVTLEDVNVLLGLPIEGTTLTGVEDSYTNDQCREMCLYYLDLPTVLEDYKKCHMVKVTTIMKRIRDYPITDDASDETCIKRARLICLLLASTIVLPDTNNHMVSLHLLPNLIDPKTCQKPSWGGATLACLYRELYKGINLGTNAIGGPMALLQLWAWTRIFTLAPQIVAEDINWNKPYSARWADNMISNLEIPSHVISVHRTSLQNLRDSDFVWLPYLEVYNKLQKKCKSGSRSWMSRCCLICSSVVEYHPVERVARQFGLLQEIPPEFPIERGELANLRSKVRKGSLYVNRATKHARYVALWDNRHNTVLVGGNNRRTTVAHPTYMQWFIRHTVMYIKDPRHDGQSNPTGFHDHGGTSRYLVDAMGLIRDEQAE